MSDEFKVQWSVSLPPSAQYAKGDMLNLRGNSVEEVEGIFDEVLADASEFLQKAADVATHLRAVAAVSDGLSPTAAPAAAGENTGGGGGGSVAELRVCSHGKRTHRTGTSAKGAWSGWFCPQPKNATDKCDPIWE